MFSRYLALVMALVFLLGTALFVFISIEMNLAHTDCFNEQGRCLDQEDDVVYHEQGSIFYFIITVGFALVSLVFFVIFSKLKDPSS